ncbi:MAG: hypothetical protein J6H18_03630 [Lachnospiraceae bacterium]|nr:hypothetical protein [Lachnospiraceae bacterium]
MNLWDLALNHVSEETVAQYQSSQPKESGSNRFPWGPLAAVAACLVLLITAVPWLYTQLIGRRSPEPPPVQDYRTLWTNWEKMREIAMAERYLVRLSGTPYEAYELTQTADPALQGEKLADVEALGAWYLYLSTPEGKKLQQREAESGKTDWLRGGIYAIRGVDPALAVCVRFLDKGEALTTDHLYTFLNPLYSFVSLSSFWDGFRASERLRIKVSEEQTTARIAYVEKEEIRVKGFFLEDSLAEQIKHTLLSCQGEWMKEAPEDLYMGCRKTLTLFVQLEGGFAGSAVLYESGYLGFELNKAEFLSGHPLLFRISQEKTAEIFRQVESQARSYTPDESATVVATSLVAE